MTGKSPLYTFPISRYGHPKPEFGLKLWILSPRLSFETPVFSESGAKLIGQYHGNI